MNVQLLDSLAPNIELFWKLEKINVTNYKFAFIYHSTLLQNYANLEVDCLFIVLF